MKISNVWLIMLLVVGSAATAYPGTAVDQLLEPYYSIQKSLASDSTAGVSASASMLAKAGRQAAAAEPHAGAQLLAISKAAAKLQTTDLKAARNGFGELSNRMIAYLKAAGAKGNPPYQFFCPMVKKYWLQRDKETHNPYYGSSMISCGELVQLGTSAAPGRH